LYSLSVPHALPPMQASLASAATEICSRINERMAPCSISFLGIIKGGGDLPSHTVWPALLKLCSVCVTYHGPFALARSCNTAPKGVDPEVAVHHTDVSSPGFDENRLR
jgi:hypothetical protein